MPADLHILDEFPDSAEPMQKNTRGTAQERHLLDDHLMNVQEQIKRTQIGADSRISKWKLVRKAMGIQNVTPFHDIVREARLRDVYAGELAMRGRREGGGEG